MSHQSLFKLSPFLKKTLFCIGSLSLLSSTLVLAQENSEPPSESMPVAPAAKENNVPLTPPTVSVPSRPPVNAAELLPPPQPVPQRSPVIEPPQALPKTSPESHNAYIDPTPYNIEPRPSVVFETRNPTNPPQITNNPTVKPTNKPSNNLTVQRNHNSPSNSNIRRNSPTNITNQRNVNQNINRTYDYKPTVINQSEQKIVSAPTVYNRATKVIKKYVPTNTSLLFPLSMPAPITSAFGWRVHPISGVGRFHAGTDIGAPTGTPVLAAYQGRVEVAGSLGGYGLTVTIRHEDSTQESLYAHLSQILVQPGQWVEQGTVIGLVGSTGYSTGPHLHFEWRHRTPSGWVAVDAGDHLKLAMEALIDAMAVASVDHSPNHN